MKLYKLTNHNDETGLGPRVKRTKWGPNVTHETSGEGGLCGPGWLHAYTDPLLAVFLNCGGGNFTCYHLWEAEGDVGKSDCGLKVGCRKLTTTKKIEAPKVTDEQRARFAILCALEVYGDTVFRHWAENWLSGKDRSQATASANLDRLERMVNTVPYTKEKEYRTLLLATYAICSSKEAGPDHFHYTIERDTYSAVAFAACIAPLDLPALARKAMGQNPKLL